MVVAGCPLILLVCDTYASWWRGGVAIGTAQPLLVTVRTTASTPTGVFSGNVTLRLPIPGQSCCGVPSHWALLAMLEAHCVPASFASHGSLLAMLEAHGVPASPVNHTVQVKMAQHLDSRRVFCFRIPAPRGALGPNGPNQNTSRIQH